MKNTKNCFFLIVLLCGTLVAQESVDQESDNNDTLPNAHEQLIDEQLQQQQYNNDAVHFVQVLEKIRLTLAHLSQIYEENDKSDENLKTEIERIAAMYQSLLMIYEQRYVHA